MRDLQIAVALVRRTADVLLVQRQGPRDRRPSWTLPGGVVGQGETLADALVRGLREETGLAVHGIGPLLFTTQVTYVSEGFISTTSCFEVTDWSGAVRVAEPDGLVLGAEFHPPAEAVSIVRRHAPPRAMREPLVAYLTGAANAGTTWTYRSLPNGVQLLLEKRWSTRP